MPSTRVVDTYYFDDALWIVTYTLSYKVKGIESNSNIALCKGFYSFKGKAYNVGRPLMPSNQQIRFIKQQRYFHLHQM